MTLLLSNGTYEVQAPGAGEPYEPRSWTTVATVRGLLSEPSGSLAARQGQEGSRVTETRTLSCDALATPILSGYRVVDVDDVWLVDHVETHRGLGLDHWTVHLTRVEGTAS